MVDVFEAKDERCFSLGTIFKIPLRFVGSGWKSSPCSCTSYLQEKIKAPRVPFVKEHHRKQKYSANIPAFPA